MGSTPPRDPQVALAVASWFKRHRASTGLNQRDFAEKIGWSQSKVSRLERGSQTATFEDVAVWAETCSDRPAELLREWHLEVGRALGLGGAERDELAALMEQIGELYVAREAVARVLSIEALDGSSASVAAAQAVGQLDQQLDALVRQAGPLKRRQTES